MASGLFLAVKGRLPEVFFCTFAHVIENGNGIIDGKQLGAISSDFVKVADSIKISSRRIRDEGFPYPVFPMCRQALPIGRLLIEKESLEGLNWNYYASFLGEFIERGLVAPERQEAFKRVYKDPDEFCCLFVVSQAFTQFLYIPYPED